MTLIDLSKMLIKTDTDMVDISGEARKDVLIYEDRLVCHPIMKERLEEAIDLFFSQPLDKGDQTASSKDET